MPKREKSPAKAPPPTVDFKSLPRELRRALLALRFTVRDGHTSEHPMGADTEYHIAVDEQACDILMLVFGEGDVHPKSKAEISDPTCWLAKKDCWCSQ